MIVPTLGVAIAITVMNFRDRDEEAWINLATCFWISANAFWMCCEFYNHEEFKFYSGFPFALGFVCVGWFYVKKLFRKPDSTL
jgi:hypothetical protein